MTVAYPLCPGCGYHESEHAAGRCPVCVCGEVVGAHAPVAVPAAPLIEFADDGRISYRCPGKDTQLRHGKYRSPVPEPRKTWNGLQVPMTQAEMEAAEQAREVVTTGPPQVPARSPQDAGEIAGYRGKQAVGLGRKALGTDWTVRALYWRAYDGTEGCGVWLTKGQLRAVATWERPAGKQGAKSGWKGAVAYAWRADVARFPTSMTLTDLEGLIR